MVAGQRPGILPLSRQILGGGAVTEPLVLESSPDCVDNVAYGCVAGEKRNPQSSL